jgi:transcriptional regulator with XRE-family HTH domain
MNGRQDPVVQRRRLRTFLRDARIHAGRTQKDVAAELYWSPSKLLRIESGSVAISMTDLKALLDLYEIKDSAKREELISIARIGRYQPWSRYRDVLSPEFMNFLGYESAASIIRQFEPRMVPALLQTHEYARHTIRAFSPRDDPVTAIENRIAARLERQQLLFDREDAPLMSFILDEGVLRRRVGSVDCMIAQIEHLKSIARLPNVTLRVLPFSVGEHPAMLGGFVLLEFANLADDDLLYIEGSSQSDVVYRESPDDVTRYLANFFDLEDLSTPASKAEPVLDRIIKDLRPDSANGEALF